VWLLLFVVNIEVVVSNVTRQKSNPLGRERGEGMGDLMDSEVVIGADTAKQFDAIVLGAGISGLVSAAILAEQGYERVLLLDDYGHVGGNHIDWSSGGYTFDIGSLIFQDDSPLLKYFPELVSLYVPIEPQWARLNPQGQITAYPISVRDDILGAGPVAIFRIFASVAYARLFHRRMRNAKEFARYWIGAYLLHRSGLESYLKRFYGVATEEIDIDLAKKRMLWISEHASVRNLLVRLKRKPSGPTNRQMARPKSGFQSLYKLAVERLNSDGIEVVLNAEMEHISKIEGQFRLRLKGQDVFANRIVSTIPIHRAEELCGLASKHRLETITLIGLFFSFSGDRGFAQPIIYNFSHAGAWKRLTMYSDFYGLTNERQYFGAEVIATDTDKSVEKAERDFREHAQANGLFRGDLKFEGSRVLDNAYPIYRKGAAQHAAAAIEALKVFGIESMGRQGGFNYQPTARASTVEAEAALDHTR
jgi:protoporphyrinogen oxidase